MRLSIILFIFLFVFQFPKVMAADPGQVGRVSYISGTVNLLPMHASHWIVCQLNRPVIAGDELWVDANAKAELQFTLANVYVDQKTNLTIANLTQNFLQLHLPQGQVQVQIREKNAGKIEVNTPNLTFIAAVTGSYRIGIDGNNTKVEMISGSAEVRGLNKAYSLAAGEAFVFSGTNLDYTQVTLSNSDSFSSWIAERQANLGASGQYVSNQMLGHEDLDRYGTWQSHPVYGNIWSPNNIPDGWAPYREGEWIWILPWGWIWVDFAPWGFAPFHYGRWVYFEDHWYWVPGPYDGFPIWGPAIVIFVNFYFGPGPFYEGRHPFYGWFPLGPGEPYFPPFKVSKNYFMNINLTNTNIEKNQILNYYAHPNTPINYVNKLPIAITAVSTKNLVNARPISNVIVPVTSDLIKQSKVIQKIPLPTPINKPIEVPVKPPQIITKPPVLIKTPPVKKIVVVKPIKPNIPVTPIQPVIQIKNNPVPVRPIISEPIPTNPVVKPIDRPVETPIVRPIEKPIERPIDRPIEPVERPIERPIERPVETPIRSAPVYHPPVENRPATTPIMREPKEEKQMQVE